MSEGNFFDFKQTVNQNFLQSFNVTNSVDALTCVGFSQSPDRLLALNSGSTGTGDRVKVSLDGRNWISRTIATAGSYLYTAYGKGLFVIASDAVGEVFQSSPDTVTWTNRTASTGTVRSLLFSPTIGEFIAGGVGSSHQVSSDGITWTNRTPIGLGGSIRHMIDDGTNVLVANLVTSTTPIYRTTDLLNFTPISFPASLQVSGMTYGGGIYLAVMNAGQVYKSFDTVTWQQVATLPTFINSIVYGNGYFVAATNSSAQIFNNVYYSRDGINWTYGGVSSVVNKVAYVNGTFCLAVSATVTTKGILASERLIL